MLNALNSEDRSTLAESSFMAYAERGEAIWLAGSPSEIIGVVGVGFVKMTKTTPSGQENTLELLGPGKCFGLVVAIEGRAYPLSAIAVTNTWYLKIPSRVILPIYQNSNGLKDRVVRTLGPRLRKAYDMMTRLSSGKVEDRLAAILFILADSYGVRHAAGLHIQVPLTRQDLAEMAGTSVETTIRVMSRWQKDGLVHTDRQAITIVQDEALSATLHLQS